MTRNIPWQETAISTLLAFPLVCFSLTALTDIVYVQTFNLFWLHCSEWLLFIGLIFGALGYIGLLIDYLVRKVRPTWFGLFGGAIVLLLAAVNSFIHTADGWTAVYPSGLTLSVVTLIAIVLTGWIWPERIEHAQV